MLSHKNVVVAYLACISSVGGEEEEHHPVLVCICLKYYLSQGTTVSVSPGQQLCTRDWGELYL